MARVHRYGYLFPKKKLSAYRRMAALFFAYSANRVSFSPAQLIRGIPGICRIVGEMFPPDFQRADRWPAQFWKV
jgi:hypothetical protein